MFAKANGSTVGKTPYAIDAFIVFPQLCLLRKIK